MCASGLHSRRLCYTPRVQQVGRMRKNARFRCRNSPDSPMDGRTRAFWVRRSRPPRCESTRVVVNPGRESPARLLVHAQLFRGLETPRKTSVSRGVPRSRATLMLCRLIRGARVRPRSTRSKRSDCRVHCASTSHTRPRRASEPAAHPHPPRTSPAVDPSGKHQRRLPSASPHLAPSRRGHGQPSVRTPCSPPRCSRKECKSATASALNGVEAASFEWRR